jgi:hypothetical protein
MRTGPLAAAAWVVAATLTLGASWSAVQVVRSAVAAPDLAVSSDDGLPVPTEPAGSATPTPSGSRATPTTPTATTPAATTASASGTGGTVVVRCVGGVPQLVSRIPKQGFTVEVDDSPGEVKFSSDRHRTEIKATCTATGPRLTVEEDDRGGDDNSGRGGGDG